MNIKRFLPAGLLSCTAALSLTMTARAQPPTVPAANTSANFAETAKYLELGGLFYGFMDVDGDLEKLARIGDKFIDLARKQKNSGMDIPKDLKAGKIIEALGLTTVKALGASSRTLEGGLYHNRAIVYAPGGPAGLFKLFGGKAAPFAAPGLAPAGSDFVGETDLHLSALLEITENVLKSVGDERLMQQYQGTLGFPVPVVNMTARELIAKLDTKIIFFGELVKGESIPIPNGKGTIPAFKAVLSFDNIDFLFDPILQMVSQAGDKVKVEKGEGFELIRPTEPLMPELPFLQPALYHDLKSKRILITSNLEYLRASLTSTKTLAGDPAFLKATGNLPKEGNSLSYVTPKIAAAFLEMMATAIKEAPTTPGAPPVEELKTIWETMQALSPMPSSPMAAVRANVQEGMLFVSNEPNSLKAAMITVPVVSLGLVSGAAAGVYSKFHSSEIQSKAAQKTQEAEEVEPSTEPEKTPAPGGASTKAIKNNLQQIAYSAQTYFLDNPKSKEVTYEKLISTELLFKLDPVSGESYKGLTIKRSGGSLTVKTGDKESISLSYQPVTD